MKYGFYCKDCGYSFMSDDKEKVQLARKMHKIKDFRNGVDYNYCPLVPTEEKKSLYARPRLAEMIIAEREVIV